MVNLSLEQVRKYAVPLVRLTMGDEVGDGMESTFLGGEYDDSVYGLFDQDKLIAVAGLGSVISEKKIWLGYWAVHPDYQGKGIGRKSLKHIEDLAVKGGYVWLLVETYEAPRFERALKVYKTAGYKEVGYLADYLADDSDAIYLRKRLN